MLKLRKRISKRMMGGLLLLAMIVTTKTYAQGKGKDGGGDMPEAKFFGTSCSYSYGPDPDGTGTITYRKCCYYVFFVNTGCDIQPIAV